MAKSITKSNALIDAGYRLSLTEVQIVLYGISLINPTQEEVPLEYQIEIRRFADLFGRTHGEIYNDIKHAIRKRFWERDFSYTNEKHEIITCRWLTRITHQDKTGFIKIKFSEDVQPYLTQLQKNFTTYYIDQIAKFKSVYSVRFYEFSIMRLKKSKANKIVFKLDIQELKIRLELTDKYKRFSHFKERVLEKAKKEINKHSDIKLSYEVIKKGRAPHEIKFTATHREKQKEEQPPLLETQTINLSPIIIGKAKDILLKVNSHLDVYDIIEQFKSYAFKKRVPDNIEGAFLGFVKKKVIEQHKN